MMNSYSIAAIKKNQKIRVSNKIGQNPLFISTLRMVQETAIFDIFSAMKKQKKYYVGVFGICYVQVLLNTLSRSSCCRCHSLHLYKAWIEHLQ